jgi:hypothetical protein
MIDLKVLAFSAAGIILTANPAVAKPQRLIDVVRTSYLGGDHIILKQGKLELADTVKDGVNLTRGQVVSFTKNDQNQITDLKILDPDGTYVGHITSFAYTRQSGVEIVIIQLATTQGKQIFDVPKYLVDLLNLTVGEKVQVTTYLDGSIVKICCVDDHPDNPSTLPEEEILKNDPIPALW